MPNPKYSSDCRQSDGWCLTGRDGWVAVHPSKKVYIFGRLALPQYNRALYQVGFELELINKYLRRLCPAKQRTKV